MTPDEDVLNVAARHFARLQADDASDDDRHEVAAWIDASPEHREAWNELTDLWGGIGELRDAPAITALRERIAPDVEPSTPPQARSRPRWLPMALAASLIALVGLPAGYSLLDRQPAPSRDAGGAAATAPRIYAAPEGKRTELLLADGSRVTLDGGTRISVDLTGPTRSIRMAAGEAFFQVRHDPAQPFVVTAGDISATAVGTAFDVRLDGADARITTTEGLVRVSAAATSSTTLLPKGRRIDIHGTRFALSDVTPQAALGWTQDRLVFAGDCLARVAAEINRASPQKLEVAASAADLPISGVFDRTNAHGLARALDEQGLVHIGPGAAGALRLTGVSGAEMQRCRR